MKKNNFIKNSLSIVMFLSLFAGEISSVSAVSSNFTFGPTNPDKNIPEILHYELRPGDSITDSVTVTNKEDTAGRFALYPADTQYNGSLHLVYKGKDGSRSLASAWLKMNENEFILKPKEKKELAFTLTIPKDAGISDAYQAGIVLEKTVEPGKDSMLKSKAALVIPVELKVTMNPRHIAKYGETDIFKTSPALWVSVALFLASMGYFVYGQRKEKLAKAKQEPTNGADKQ